MSDENEDLLNVDASPTTVSRKPRRPGKRVNNKPLIILGGAIMIVVALFAVAMSNRMVERQSAQQNEPTNGGNSAVDSAREFMIRTKGMVSERKEPEPPPPAPAPAPTILTKYIPIRPQAELPSKVEKAPEPPAVIPTPPSARPEPVKVDPLIAQMRQKRLAQAESAISSRVAVQVGSNAMQSTGNDPVSELERIQARLMALDTPANTNAEYERRMARAVAAQRAASSTSGVSMASNSSASADYSSRNDLSATGQFTGDAERWMPVASVEAPKSRYMLLTGAVIPATLVTGVNSELPGQIIGQVSQNVYDTATGYELLIPQGSRLIGEYSSQVAYGQSRLFAVWQRVIFPDGKTLDLGAMPASSGSGQSGLKDRVNNHYFRVFGTALMMSAVVAGIDQTQDNSSSSGDKKRMGDSMSEALGQNFGNLIIEMMRKNMAIAPTLEIRPGFRLNVMLVRDLEFKGPYRAFDYAMR